MKHTILLLTITLSALLLVPQAFCLDYNSCDNPFDISCPVFDDAGVLVKSQKIVLTEDLVSIDYGLSRGESKKVSAVIDCTVLGYQRLCNDILIPLDFCIKSGSKEIPFEVFLNGKLADKSVYYKGLNESNGEFYVPTDKIEIRFEFTLDGEKRLNVSYKNLRYRGTLSFGYDIPLAKNTGGMPIDYTFVYKGIEDSRICPRGIGISGYDESSRYFENAEDVRLNFVRFTEDEFFWKAELKQHSFPNKAKFGMGFDPLSEIGGGSSEKYSENLLYFMTKSQFAFLRNMFYANHGYEFKSKKYKDYFSKESWYKINPSFKESDFNEIERANIGLIRKFEEEPQ